MKRISDRALCAALDNLLTSIHVRVYVAEGGVQHADLDLEGVSELVAAMTTAQAHLVRVAHTDLISSSGEDPANTKER